MMYSEKERRDNLVKETVEEANKSIGSPPVVTFDDSNLNLPSEEETAKLKDKFSNQNNMNKLDDKKSPSEARESFTSGKASDPPKK